MSTITFCDCGRTAIQGDKGREGPPGEPGKPGKDFSPMSMYCYFVENDKLVELWNTSHSKKIEKIILTENDENMYQVEITTSHKFKIIRIISEMENDAEVFFYYNRRTTIKKNQKYQIFIYW